MNDTADDQPDRQLLFLQEMAEEHATIAGDVAEIDSHTWAIHGVIPVGGDVILAEFETYDQARTVLDKLATDEPARMITHLRLDTNRRQRNEMTSFAPGGSAVHESDDGAAVFAAVRRRLFGIAYRMVGSWTEAEDIVQDVWIRWQGYDRTTVLEPDGVPRHDDSPSTRTNATQSARVRYESYVGDWVHEPADSGVDPASRTVQSEELRARHPGPAGAAVAG